MEKTKNKLKNDFQPESRKQDHIELAFDSATLPELNDTRFNYEPVLSGHLEKLNPFEFLGKILKVPFWVSSMTGGTDRAEQINKNLAITAGKYGFGMGLGSCRSLLSSDKHLKDFKVRKHLGDELPLYANLGIAQIEQIVKNKHYTKLHDLIKKVSANGLIVHINPTQEWLQPKGDRIEKPPLETLRVLLDKIKYPVIVKEVGQGMGPKSIEALLKLPIEALEFGAFGGTNFAKLELKRHADKDTSFQQPLAFIGHTAEEMTSYINNISIWLGQDRLCNQFIISGGIQSVLDGYYCLERINAPAVIGQAGAMLRHAKESLELLDEFMQTQINTLMFAKAFLQIKD